MGTISSDSISTAFDTCKPARFLGPKIKACSSYQTTRQSISLDPACARASQGDHRARASHSEHKEWKETARTPMTASSGTPRPKSDILSSVLERARTAGAWRRAGAPMNWLWRAEQSACERNAIGAAVGAPSWKADADAAIDTARIIAFLHMVSGGRKRILMC